MRKLKMLVGACAAAAAVLFLGTAKAEAATLEIVDTFGGSQTVWTLDVQTGCTICDVTLTVEFNDEAGADTNAFTGKFLDSVQWVISNPNVDPTAITLDSTTAGTTANWEFDLDESLSGGNQCNGGGKDSVCGEWITGGGLGFGPIVNDSTLEWEFTVTFASALPAELIAGNIRAAFNNPDGSNFRTFSPGGGFFDEDDEEEGEEDGGGVPEPATMALLGIGLAAAGARFRRRAAAVR